MIDSLVEEPHRWKYLTLQLRQNALKFSEMMALLAIHKQQRPPQT
jgi:hypothetical protein